jgi:hypothetical protein
MAITDLLPANPAQGYAVLFNAAAIGQSVLRPPQRVVLDTFQIDCTISESIDYDADVTEFEVETGSNITDNRRTKPLEMSIAGLVSETPLDPNLIIDALQLAAGPLGIAVRPGVGALSSALFGAVSMTSHAFNSLLALYNSDATFTISGGPRGSFTNMVVKSLRFTRDAKTGDALAFAATFKEIRTVETATTVINTPAVMQTPQNAGQKSTTAASFDPDALYKKTIGPWLDGMGLAKDPSAK